MKKYSIGIDLGGTKILTALVDKQTGEVIHSVKKKTKKDKGPKNIIKKMIDSIDELLNETPIDDISSIGIGAAGQVDREHGILIAAAKPAISSNSAKTPVNCDILSPNTFNPLLENFDNFLLLSWL